ncbi:MAG TPA: hypothetical protein VIL09_04785 [Microvirga sp.]|jgi:hypothetical protein
MLVYGDAERCERADEKARSLTRDLTSASELPPGLDRHAALVAVFIGLGELVQGMADAAFNASGEDNGSPEEATGMAALVGLARAIHRSWTSEFAETGPLPHDALNHAAGALAATPIRVKRPEGYAFYALYPESYLEAASRSGLGPRTRVIGLRSIGTGLAALVAAGLGAPAPVTLRPTGHPFGRELRIGEALTRDLLRDSEADFAIVDEGPGLSGSSFGAVIDWLEAHGIARGRIHAFPSHGGDLGPQASAAHRERWASLPRHVVAADDWLLHGQGPAHRLETWLADALGPLDGPLHDISGGGWRALQHANEAAWPAANIQQERRKFLVRARGETYLAKFVGLGADGRAAHERALLLHRAGFTPQPLALRHGFLVERWMEGALSLDEAEPPRAILLDRLGAYLGFRARALPVPDGEGASLRELAAMAVHNAGEALGGERARQLEGQLAGIEAGEAAVRRVATDNRLHPHEWIVAGGAILKTDALDHAFAHDLVGCQDIAWDIAGAIVEFGLAPVEAARLAAAVGREAGAPVHGGLVRRLVPCYLAFQLGAAAMGAAALAGSGEEERLRRAAGLYAARLDRWIADEAASAPDLPV